MTEIYTREGAHAMVRATAQKILAAAERDPRLLELLDDASIEVTDRQALAFIAHGYGRKVIASEAIIESHRDELARYDVGLLTTTSLRLAPANAPDITPCSLLICGRPYRTIWAHSCSVTFRRAYERVDARFPRGTSSTFGSVYSMREADPEMLTVFLSRFWLTTGNMDELHAVIDWLVAHNELRVLASCIQHCGQSCDPYIALATRAPDALKYMACRSVECQSNTVRDLFLLHGQGRKLSVHLFVPVPDFAVHHWDEVGPVGREWFSPWWRDILQNASELPKSPIPMFLLRELANTVEPAKLKAHIAHVVRYCQGYDDYEGLCLFSAKKSGLTSAGPPYRHSRQSTGRRRHSVYLLRE